MRKGIWKKGMAAVMTAALMTGNVGNYGADICSVVKAADIEYVPLNQEFESTNEAYFQLPEGGVVSFGTDVNVYQIAEDGNETKIHQSERSKVNYQLRLPKGVYRAKGYDYNSFNKITPLYNFF